MVFVLTNSGSTMALPTKTQALMEALQKGPVAVSVDASQWWLYHGGAVPTGFC